MFVLRFLRTPAGAGIRIGTGLLLLVGGGVMQSLPGILSMMGGMSLVVTGTADALSVPRSGK